MGRKWKEKLTRSSLLPLVGPGLVAPGGLAQGLVADADGDDGQEGEDERRRAADVPALEDDAQVRRVPREEHLRQVKSAKQKRTRGRESVVVNAHVHVAHVRHAAAAVASVVHAAVIHTAVVHVAVVHVCVIHYVVVARSSGERRRASASWKVDVPRLYLEY